MKKGLIIFIIIAILVIASYVLYSKTRKPLVREKRDSEGYAVIEYKGNTYTVSNGMAVSFDNYTAKYLNNELVIEKNGIKINY